MARGADNQNLAREERWLAAGYMCQGICAGWFEEGFEIFLLREAIHPTIPEAGRDTIELVRWAGADIVF
jgi:hypothetical protein